MGRGGRSYRIAYLNPYPGRAEEQAFQSLRAAAGSRGWEMTSLLPSDLAEASPFDFIISTTALVRKTTSHPIFLSAHAPRMTYCDTEEVYQNVASYDGYLCIADTLQRYFRHLASSLGKTPIEPGFYYDCPQILDLAADIPAAVAGGSLALCYFGTNWDRRTERLFHLLGQRQDVRFFGPEPAWWAYGGQGYRGSTPFDGVSVQRQYAEAGVGLVCLSQDHLVDDVVSNRVFEIVSVGAAAIAPDSAWMRANFGDSLFYYDPFGGPATIARRIDAIMAEITADPHRAADMARRARDIFEQRFSAEVVLTNAVAHYEAWRAAQAARAARFAETRIDVIMRTGGGRPGLMERALRSLEQQAAGRFRLIVVNHGGPALPGLANRTPGRIDEIILVEAPGAGRGRALAAGLAEVRAETFLLLDDDDYLLSDHVLRLLSAMSAGGSARQFAYSDILRLDEGGARTGPFDNGLSILKEGEATGEVTTLLERFSSHCFLASSAALLDVPFKHWDLNTAEDGLLIFSLLRTASPVHSPGATCVYSQGRADSSRFMEDPQRPEDEVSLAIEIAEHYRQVQKRFVDEGGNPRELIHAAVRRLVDRRSATIQGLAPGQAPLGNWAELGGAKPESTLMDDNRIWIEAPLDPARLHYDGQLLQPAPGSAVTVRPRHPWEFTLTIEVGDYAVAGCSVLPVLTFTGGDQELIVAALDIQGKLRNQTRIPSSAKLMRAGVSVIDSESLGAVVLQASRFPCVNPVVVRSLHLGYDKKELAEAFGMAPEPVARLAGRLRDFASRQVVNAPANPGVAIPLDYRSPGSVFRSPVADGRYSEGAPRTFGSGVIPWDYFVQIPLPVRQRSGLTRMRLRLRDIGESCYAMLVDTCFEQVLGDRVAVLGGKQAAEIWLDLDETQDCYLVLQSTDLPQNALITLVGIDAIA